MNSHFLGSNVFLLENMRERSDRVFVPKVVPLDGGQIRVSEERGRFAPVIVTGREGFQFGHVPPPGVAGNRG